MDFLDYRISVEHNKRELAKLRKLRQMLITAESINNIWRSAEKTSEPMRQDIDMILSHNLDLILRSIR